jgi:geranylgeranyl diphosphate synthase, type II
LLERFDTFGRCLGLAFQITDDLLDVEGDADQTGKRVGKDAARGKLTYPGFLGIAESRRRAERLCQEARKALTPLGPAVSRLLELVSSFVNRKS